MTLVDAEAPWTIRAAALLVVVFAVAQFVMALARGGEQRTDTFLGPYWPLRELLSLSVLLISASQLARLNGMAYWFTVTLMAIGIVVIVVGLALAGFGVFESPLLAGGDPVGWLYIAILFVLFALLVAKPSRRAPWGTLKGL